MHKPSTKVKCLLWKIDQLDNGAMFSRTNLGEIYPGTGERIIVHNDPIRPGIEVMLDRRDFTPLNVVDSNGRRIGSVGCYEQCRLAVERIGCGICCEIIRQVQIICDGQFMISVEGTDVGP